MGKKQNQNPAKDKKSGRETSGNADKKNYGKEAPSYTDSETEGEEMTVELDLDDGSHVVCAIVTILECREKDYIALLPLDENGENQEGEVWFYRYFEDENDVNAEPVLEYIDDDEEYEMVADAFDEYLDNAEFDEFVEE